MRVFVSYVKPDHDVVSRVVHHLGLAGFALGDLDPAFDGQVGADDVALVMVSERSAQNQWWQHEIAVLLYRSRTEGLHIVPVRLDETRPPSGLDEYRWIDLWPSFEAGVAQLRDTLVGMSVGGDALPPRRDGRAEATAALRAAFAEGRLTVMCGAGVSIDAGLPDWPQLLMALLADMFAAGRTRSADARQLAELFQRDQRTSSIVVAQYLESSFGEEFVERVRAALYREAPEVPTSAIVDAIVDLCRPRRSGPALRAVVTFNFDDVLETALEAARVDHCVVHGDRHRPRPHELPVYHVHGFLARGEGNARSDALVFAEEAYHSQFMDPFSWSTLTQLAELTQSTCLLLGVSLNDPNLRRLLDVARRKNTERVHYLVRRRVRPSGDDPVAVELNSQLEVLNVQDAERLGLATIWVDDFADVPGLLADVCQGP